MERERDDENADTGDNRSIVIAGMIDLKAMQRRRSSVAVKAILLAGVRDTVLEDVSAVLVNIVSVKILNLSQTPVQSLKALSRTSYSIAKLDLSNTRVTQREINYVGFVVTLQDLEVGSNLNIKNISFVEKLARLETLGIAFTNVTDLSSLEELQNLQYLDVAGDRLNKGAIGVINNMYQLQELDASFSSLDIASLDNSVFARAFRITYSSNKDTCRAYYPKYGGVTAPISTDLESPVRTGNGLLEDQPRKFTLRVEEKTKSHPLYEKGSRMAFRVAERDAVDFGKPLILAHGRKYIFTVEQKRHPNDPSREHPFYVDYNIGGGPVRNANGRVAPLGKHVRGVVSGELRFQPDIRDGSTLYAECANHLFMGFPLTIEHKAPMQSPEGTCALCGNEVEDALQMYGCKCDDIWYCTMDCALAGNRDHVCELE